jgi:hypothetical protein
MAPKKTANSRVLVFDGQFENSVLGTFRIIRGFADLQDLATVSVPYLMEESPEGGSVIGQQRSLDQQHAERIKKYLESGEQRFLPEVILSVRVELRDELDTTGHVVGVVNASDSDGIRIGRASKNRNNPMLRVSIEREKIAEILARKLIRRVDGNHRLALAEGLREDPSLLTKYLAPFCIVLLGPTGEPSDDYSESLIFHTINSTALPLESEHALKLILGQNADFDMKPEQEFSFSPDLHFTRLLRDGLLTLPEPIRARVGNRPLTSLRGAVRGLLDMDPSMAEDLATLRRSSVSVLAVLNEIVARLGSSQPALCSAEFFIELCARVWKGTSDSFDHNVRVNETVAYLEQLATWLGSEGLLNLKEGQSFSKQILDIFRLVRTRIPKRIFLARWYPTVADGEEYTRAKLRLDAIKQALKELGEEEGAYLQLVDMGTQTGTTFPIHARMYEAIASADIIVIDLTGVRPNVCVEAGYALRNHEKNRLIFIFQPNDLYKSVPFDLNTFRYEKFNDTGEIPGLIKPHITTILHESALGTG